MMRVNEIFYSLQGEGWFTGTPAVFIRFSGCNLKCGFCDTDHSGFTEMTADDIVEQAAAFPARHAVLTGGEPTLQVTAELVEKLHNEGFFVQMETNGTRRLPDGVSIDWITCSPKYEPVVMDKVDELKVVYDGSTQQADRYGEWTGCAHCLQPCDTKDTDTNRRNLEGAIAYCLEHPQWRLSLQTHKMINVR